MREHRCCFHIDWLHSKCIDHIMFAPADHNDSNNINLIPMAMFMVLLSLCSHGKEFTRFIWWMQTRCLLAANYQTSMTDSLLESTLYGATVHTCHRHLLLLLSPKVYTCFSIPQKSSSMIMIIHSFRQSYFGHYCEPMKAPLKWARQVYGTLHFFSQRFEKLSFTNYSASSCNLLRSRCMTSSSFSFCHSFLLSAILLSAIYFHWVAQQMHSFPTWCSLPPSIFPWIISCSNDSCHYSASV